MYSLILMDLNMNVMDGYEASKLINQRIEKGIYPMTTIIA